MDGLSRTYLLLTVKCSWILSCKHFLELWFTEKVVHNFFVPSGTVQEFMCNVNISVSKNTLLLLLEAKTNKMSSLRFKL